MTTGNLAAHRDYYEADVTAAHRGMAGLADEYHIWELEVVEVQHQRITLEATR